MNAGTSLFVVLTFFSQGLLAESRLQIFSSSPPNYNNVVIDSQNASPNRQTITSIFMNVSCFPTNLRSVSNPLSPYNDVIANIQVEDSNGTPSFISFKFPAALAGDEKNPNFALTGVNMNPFNSTQILAGPAGSKVVSSSNRLLRIDLTNMATMKIKPDGSIDVNRKINFITSIQFEQVPSSKANERADVIDKFGNYAGVVQYSGPLKAQISHSISNDLKVLTINASFPGAAGFCGGYYSPLMIFFNENEIPRFENKSSFKLSKHSQKIYWPEAKAKAYFLAFDRNKNKRIDDGEELFGDQKNFSNGFEALKELDSNKDGIVDSKDKEFYNLLLWRDINGNGIAEKNEIKKITHYQIKSIDLNYVEYFKAFGDRAEMKQRSFIKYNDLSGKLKMAPIYDVYFKSAK
ncbi:MAG: hypothetical protein L6Q37_05445 [Bdellovibrionaceae bacterium]|nr:hypothetical protein [Pseudobdellovibrionaceae bacterium]NUM58761.1 hypothetical protein [Pseudobdellovibrionaceae bacterium]